MKYYFIINPNSGKIDTNQFEQRIFKGMFKEKLNTKYSIHIMQGMQRSLQKNT